MIHPATLPAVSGLLPSGDALPALPAEGLEAADFGALLAFESETLAPPGLAPQPPVATTPSAYPEAAVLPESGKPLPDALPVAMSGETSAPEPRYLPVRTIAAARHNDPVETPGAIAVADVAEPAARPERGQGDAPMPVEPGIAALPAQSPESAPALAAPVATSPAEGPAAAHAEPPGRPIPAPVPATAPGPALPRQAEVAPNPVQPPPVPLAQPAPREQPQTAQVPAQTAAQPASAPITLSLVTAAIVPAPRIGEPQPRLTLPIAGAGPAPEPAKPTFGALRVPPAPSLAAERRQVPGKAVPIALPDRAPPGAELPAPIAAMSTPAAQALPTPATFAPADPALRPHDFTQLVDRLVAARELAAPQAFAVAVQHGEFGQVQLRFRHEGDGLSITLASADPDFARVVSAAPAPVLAALPAETAGQAGQRFDSPTQSASANGNSAQHRGGSPERREDRHGPADNPAPPRQGEGRGSRRGGIFA